MPDFEALIQHQQQRATASKDRLKVVETPLSKNTSASIGPNTYSNFLSTLLASFLGSFISIVAIIFLYSNNYIDINFTKFTF